MRAKMDIIAKTDTKYRKKIFVKLSQKWNSVLIWKYLVKWNCSEFLCWTEIDFTKFLSKFCERLRTKFQKFSLCITQCGKMKNLLSPKRNFVKSTTYLVILIVKPLLSRNFCQKSIRELISVISTVLIKDIFKEWFCNSDFTWNQF